MSSSLIIWSNVSLPKSVSDLLRDRLGGHTLIAPEVADKSNLVAGPPDPSFALADVAFGQPHPQDVVQSSNLKWVHLSSAGYTRYDTDALRAHASSRDLRFTNSSGVYNEPCAQHVLAMMLSIARQLNGAQDDQRAGSTWPYLPLREKSFLLNGQSALIVGYGAIGQRLAELLAPFQMKLMGFRRTPTGRESIPVRPISEVDAHLPTADHVINILPAAPGTQGFFDTKRISTLKPGVRFYNIGRGNTVDQTALVDALKSGRVDSSYLDVTDPEPLPASHALWTAPNSFITPHTAGGHVNEFERLTEHFLMNFDRFTTGQTLVDRIF